MNPIQASLRAMGRAAFLLPVLYMGFITFLSHLTGRADSVVLLFGIEIQLHFSNVLHLPLYYVLGIFWKVAFAARERPPRRDSLWVFLLTAGFGVLDEFHQSFVPGRFPSALDVVTDALGGVLACWTWPAVRPWLIAKR